MPETQHSKKETEEKKKKNCRGKKNVSSRKVRPSQTAAVVQFIQL